MSGILLLRELVVLLAVSIPVVAVAQRLRIPTVVGFLLAGLAVGPHGFGLISQPWIVQELAEIGVVLLLFTIGLELSLSQILKLGRHLFLSGTFQVGLTTLVVAVAAFVLIDAAVNRALFFGSLVALSSTAIVLKAYVDRGEIDTPPACIAVAILLFQDLYVVPLMLFVPILANIGAGGVVAWRSMVGSLVRRSGVDYRGAFSDTAGARPGGPAQKPGAFHLMRGIHRARCRVPHCDVRFVAGLGSVLGRSDYFRIQVPDSMRYPTPFRSETCSAAYSSFRLGCYWTFIYWWNHSLGSWWRRWLWWPSRP